MQEKNRLWCKLRAICLLISYYSIWQYPRYHGWDLCRIFVQINGLWSVVLRIYCVSCWWPVSLSILLESLWVNPHSAPSRIPQGCNLLLQQPARHQALPHREQGGCRRGAGYRGADAVHGPVRRHATHDCHGRLPPSGVSGHNGSLATQGNLNFDTLVYGGNVWMDGVVFYVQM